MGSRCANRRGLVVERTGEIFDAEAVAIAERHHRIAWRAPGRDEAGRDEDTAQLLLREEAPINGVALYARASSLYR